MNNANPVIGKQAMPPGTAADEAGIAPQGMNPIERALFLIMQRMDRVEKMLADSFDDKPEKNTPREAQGISGEVSKPIITEPAENLPEQKKPMQAEASDGEQDNKTQLPAFVREVFGKDLKSRPAEAMLNLIADIHQGKPGVLNDKTVKNPDFLGMITKISRQVRKDRLTEKFADAGEMISDIEALFKEIPEIEMRPDAYEIAYKLVKGKIGEAMPSAKETTNKDKEPDLKEKAFVESSKGASTGSSDTELTPVQREICAKLGISESTFRKYMK